MPRAGQNRAAPSALLPRSLPRPLPCSPGHEGTPHHMFAQCLPGTWVCHGGTDWGHRVERGLLGASSLVGREQSEITAMRLPCVGTERQSRALGKRKEGPQRAPCSGKLLREGGFGAGTRWSRITEQGVGGGAARWKVRWRQMCGAGQGQDGIQGRATGSRVHLPGAQPQPSLALPGSPP